MSEIIWFYLQLILALITHFLAIYLSIKNKHNICSWILIINLLLAIFYPITFHRVIAYSYLLFIFIRYINRKLKGNYTSNLNTQFTSKKYE